VSPGNGEGVDQDTEAESGQPKFMAAPFAPIYEMTFTHSSIVDFWFLDADSVKVAESQLSCRKL